GYPGPPPAQPGYAPPPAAPAPAGPVVPPQGSPAPGSPLRVVSEAEATARLRIMLPTTMPTPSTALRPQAVWEDTHEADVSTAAPFAQTTASPASPSTLPSQLAAMTTATMVIPLPPSLRPGSGLLTTTLPPDQAAQANAARIGGAFRDTIEEIFGVDLDTVDPAELGLAPRRPVAPAAPASSQAAAGYDADYESGGYDSGYDSGSDLGRHADELAAQAFPPIPPSPWAEPSHDLTPTVSFPRPVPAEVFGGAYGVPTQQAPLPVAANRLAPFGRPADPADPARHALALRYLGGIFHDSSGESSYLDPEEVDHGWIPSALGAVPPDAPTEQLARIPAEFDPAPTTRIAVPPRPRPQPQPVASAAAAPPAPAPAPAAPPAPTDTGSGRGRSGGRSAHGSRATGSTPAARTAHSERAGARRRKSAAPATSPASTDRIDTADKADKAAASAKSRARALTIAGLCVAAFALLYGVALLMSGNVVGGAIPKGTVVEGVPIGGLSPTAARAKLESTLGAAATQPLELLVGQTPATIDPAKSGLSFDVDATLSEAESQRTNPFTIIPALFGVHHDLTPVTDVDSAALTKALNIIAASYNTPLVEGKITFSDGQPVVTAPKEGRGFDVPTAVTAISSGYLQVGGAIELPVSSLEPLASPEALQVALEQYARPAVSAPITLDTGGVSTVLTQTQIGNVLSISPNADGTMVPTVDGAKLRADLNPAAFALEKPGADAAYTIENGTPQLVPERDGTGFAPQALASALSGVLTSAAPREATLQPGALPPAFTTAEAQALGVTSVLGSATLPVPDAADRAVDTQRATDLVMGSVVAPGATWSFDKTVGAPTAANGFSETDAAEAKAQGVDLSGGDDLVATAVFDAAFRSGLGDTVHHPNAAYFSSYPVGLDAAVVWPGTDLQWTNTSGHPVYLYASYGSGQLTVAVLGQPAYDQVSVTVSGRTSPVQAGSDPRSGCPAQAGSEGFQVIVTRVLLRGGAQVGTEQYHVTYVPFAGTVCGSTGTGSTASPGSTAGSGGSDTSGSGSSSSAPKSGGTGGSSQQPPASSPSPSAPAPAPSSTPGALGGLLH
ncbi:VanW family protein, partial [Actinospica durhamensis]